MQCEAKPALVGANVISHEVWIFTDIHCLSHQSFKTLSAFYIRILVTCHTTTAGLASGPVLPVYHLL